MLLTKATRSAALDPLDKKYQVDSKFKPDKETTWNHDAENDGWVHAHNSLRREMRMLIGALKPISLSPMDLWQIEFIQSAWHAHYEHVKAHHENEDNLFVPFLKTRIAYPEKCSKDHYKLADQMKNLNNIARNLKQSDTPEEFLCALQKYETFMLPHLEEEERECLPLMRAYFTPEEIGPMIQKILQAGPKVEMGSFIAAMGVERMRGEFMKQEGIPFFVWHIDFKHRLAHFQQVFEKPLEHIKMGVAPGNQQKRLFFCI